MKLLKSLKLELQPQQDHSYRADLIYIAQTIAQKVTATKLLLEKQLNNHLSWKNHLATCLVVFFVITAQNLVLTYARHRYNRLHKFLPFSHKPQKQRIQLKPILIYEEQNLDGLEIDKSVRWRNQSLLTVNPNYETEQKQHARNQAPQYIHN